MTINPDDVDPINLKPFNKSDDTDVNVNVVGLAKKDYTPSKYVYPFAKKNTWLQWAYHTYEPEQQYKARLVYIRQNPGDSQLSMQDIQKIIYSQDE